MKIFTICKNSLTPKNTLTPRGVFLRIATYSLTFFFTACEASAHRPMILDMSEILFLEGRKINFDLSPLHVDFVTPNCLNEKQPSKLH